MRFTSYDVPLDLFMVLRAANRVTISLAEIEGCYNKSIESLGSFTDL